MAASVAEIYRTYLDRFDSEVGPCEVGAYLKHRGRLIKKLASAEFEEKWTEYEEVRTAYAAIMERGDTINDVLAKLLRERCDELVLARVV